MQFESYWPAGGCCSGCSRYCFVIGNMIQPRMQGDSLNLDPVVVLLSLALWGQFLGVIGMFLSTPLTVMAMVVLASSRGRCGWRS